MTNREFYTAIVSGTVNDEVKEFASEAIRKMDERLAARSSKPTKKQEENQVLKASILKMLTAEPMLAKEISEKMEISVQKASALCRQLVETGDVKVVSVKVPKKGEQKAYAIA